MTAPTLSIVIPVYNEEEVIESAVCHLLSELDAADVTFELILAENGSTDTTLQKAKALLADKPCLKVIHLDKPDYGRAMRAGFLASCGMYMANFSIDFMDLAFLRSALSALDKFDVVLGSKYVGGGEDHRLPVRRIGGMVMSSLPRLLFALPVADTHGLMVLRRDRAMQLVERCRFGNEILDTELIVRAHRAGLSITELPVRVEEVRPSRLGALRRARRMLRQLVALRIVLWQEGRWPK